MGALKVDDVAMQLCYALLEDVRPADLGSTPTIRSVALKLHPLLRCTGRPGDRWKRLEVEDVVDLAAEKLRAALSRQSEQGVFPDLDASDLKFDVVEAVLAAMEDLDVGFRVKAFTSRRRDRCTARDWLANAERTSGYA